MGHAAVLCDLHDVVDPRRHPGQGQHLPQHHGLQRGQRRGLVHEGVPAGEGGGHLQYVHTHPPKKGPVMKNYTRHLTSFPIVIYQAEHNLWCPVNVGWENFAQLQKFQVK